MASGHGILCNSSLPSSVTRTWFLIKPEAEERRQRSKVKWQVCLSGPGGRVRRPWSEAGLLPLPLRSETELHPGMEAGARGLVSEGLSLRAGFTRRWIQGRSQVSFPWSTVAVLLFCSFSRLLPVHGLRGILKGILSGPVLSL